jgi:catechol 2,3-dioxygenase-like lactoylglutathione lyase family enzyme
MVNDRILGMDVAQIALVVRDLDAALERWIAVGYGPFRVYEYGQNLARRRYRGSEGTFSMLLAVSDTSPQIELVQPLAGPSIYEDWLTKRGEGLHHVGFVVEDEFDAAVERLVTAGYPAIQSGDFGPQHDGRFSYHDTQDALGLIVELVRDCTGHSETVRVVEGAWHSKGHRNTAHS